MNEMKNDDTGEPAARRIAISPVTMSLDSRAVLDLMRSPLAIELARFEKHEEQ
jgi:hypothetical protein